MAGNTIKGLTVEIGGDTTKLGKALQDVEKKSRSLSGELGQINRLLEMDPGNTELLAQKQKVLADAVEQTRKKLETLQEAEKQVQKQFERGEVSEEQVRALQREIIATTKKMDGYEKAVRETAEEIARLGDDSNAAGKHLDDAGKEAKKSGDELDKFAGSAKDAGDAGDTMGKKLAGAAKTGLVAVGTAAVGLVTGLVASAEATREYRGEMGKLESAYTTAGHKAETATKAYQTLQGVIGETDQSVEAAQQIALLANSEQDVAKWAGLAAGVVGRFGDALQPETFFESANETLKLGEATGTYVQLLEGTGYSVDKFNAGLEACTTVQEKQAYMLKITDQLLGGAADKYRETNAEVIRANEANEAWMASMADVGGALEPILSDVKLLGASLLSEAVPGVQGLAEAFRGILNGDAGASADFGAQLSGLVTTLLDKLTGMLPTVATVGVSLIATLATSMVQQIPTLLSTGGQIASQLLGGIAANAPSMAQGALDLIGGLVSGFQTNEIQNLVRLYYKHTICSSVCWKRIPSVFILSAVLVLMPVIFFSSILRLFPPARQAGKKKGSNLNDHNHHSKNHRIDYQQQQTQNSPNPASCHFTIHSSGLPSVPEPVFPVSILFLKIQEQKSFLFSGSILDRRHALFHRCRLHFLLQTYIFVMQ